MEGYKELLERLNELVSSLENGELSMDELADLESVTRKLHERSIILRYKAFESSVLGDLPAETPEVLVEEVISEPEPEPTPDPEPEIEEEEETAFDFAIFDTDEAEDAKEEEVVEAAHAEPEEIAPDPVETIIPEPIAEIEEEEITPKQEEVIPEPIVEETPSTQVVAAPSGSSFLDKLGQPDSSSGGRFAAPLDSLIGAFGLNERLRFINDLFDGSSEKFSDAIKALDSQAGLDSARVKAADYAEENEWDPEEEAVVEFMNYLNRRYA
jgi:hypothetical protein